MTSRSSGLKSFSFFLHEKCMELVRAGITKRTSGRNAPLSQGGKSAPQSQDALQTRCLSDDFASVNEAEGTEKIPQLDWNDKYSNPFLSPFPHQQASPQSSQEEYHSLISPRFQSNVSNHRTMSPPPPTHSGVASGMPLLCF